MKNTHTKEISIIMPFFNAEKYIKEAIESVLAQSFTDFEFIMIDDGSTDDSLSIVQGITDERIVLLENEHDLIASLNIGIGMSTGKYIARMDADDTMHVDRLKIQYSIMEEEVGLTVCGTWVHPFGEGVPKNEFSALFSGWITDPLLQLLKYNIIYHPTAMIRKSFFDLHHLKYENYPSAEDYRLWTEVARRGGQFYVESFPLLSYRISSEQVSCSKKKELLSTTWLIKKEIIDTLIEQSGNHRLLLEQVYDSLLKMRESELVSEQQITNWLYEVMKKVNVLNLTV